MTSQPLLNRFKDLIRSKHFCVYLLAALLILIAFNSYWISVTVRYQPEAWASQIALLLLTLVLVSYLTSIGHKKQDAQLYQATQSQKILYNIAASINTCRELRELLNRFCESIQAALQAESVSVWLVTQQQQIEYVASAGIEAKHYEQYKQFHLDPEFADMLKYRHIIYDNHDYGPVSEIPRINARNTCLIVPLHYQSRTLGFFMLELAILRFVNVEEFEQLLSTIGRHLGMAIEKTRQDQESRREIIVQERNLIANELHDSLAQTLASLRFQVRVLDENLQPTSEFQAIRGIEQVENSLDEAYKDLRELIAHCRTPINSQGLVPAIEKLLSRFRKESGIHVLFQKEWLEPNLPPNMEMHIFRIVQEAINNIRKHSNANHVRVLLRNNANGNHQVLVENDGVGFDMPSSSEHPGEHLGLTIMQERARHLGGKLRIESEPDEGTRIELTFMYTNETNESPLDRLSGIQ